MDNGTLLTSTITGETQTYSEWLKEFQAQSDVETFEEWAGGVLVKTRKFTLNERVNGAIMQSLEFYVESIDDAVIKATEEKCFKYGVMYVYDEEDTLVATTEKQGSDNPGKWILV